MTVYNKMWATNSEARDRMTAVHIYYIRKWATYPGARDKRTACMKVSHLS